MNTISLELLAAVTGGDADGCPVTNKMSSPVSIYSPESRRWTELGPGQSGTLPVENSVFYPYNRGVGGGVDGCKPGRAFDIVPGNVYADMPNAQRTAG